MSIRTYNLDFFSLLLYSRIVNMYIRTYIFLLKKHSMLFENNRKTVYKIRIIKK